SSLSGNKAMGGMGGVGYAPETGSGSTGGSGGNALGGAIFNTNGGAVNVTGSTFSAEVAVGDGWGRRLRCTGGRNY
ncbi:MAG: hypothetical protein ABIP91_05220, partial [Sphingomicrobium sp.]